MVGVDALGVRVVADEFARARDVVDHAVVRKIKRQARVVEHVLDVVLGGVAAQRHRDLAILEADTVIVVGLEVPRPAREHLVDDARLADDIMRGLAARLVVGHRAREVVPLRVARLAGAEHAAHLGDPAGKAQHARVLLDHGAVAPGARDDAHARLRELHERLDELGRRLAGGVHRRLGAGEHGAVGVGDDVAHLAQALRKLAGWTRRERGVAGGHGASLGAG